jgi:formylglycine-generating enzyme required for sulfatase activity
VLRREIGFIAVLFGIAVAVAGVSLYSSHVEAVRRDNEAALKARNLGRFTLSLEPFGWDPAAQRAIAVDAAPLGLAWQLLKWTDDGPGQPLAEHDDVERGAGRVESGALVEDVEARGGRAFLSIQRRGCAPSLLPLKELPGYAERELPRPVFRISVPSCAATRAAMIEIPAGAFIFGGAGVPPASGLGDYPELQIEHRITLPRFWIDRTEVTNAAFDVFARMAARTGIAAPIYPRTPQLAHAADPRRPVTGINWDTARAYCRYLGKELPTSEQWVKAMRGGEQLPDGSPNPIPNRNFPFGTGDPLAIAALDPAAGPADVATHPGDVSPYGVLDLTGNVQEWTLSAGDDPGIRILRGGGVEEHVRNAIVYVMAIPNSRIASQPLFAIGERCAINE